MRKFEQEEKQEAERLRQNMWATGTGSPGVSVGWGRRTSVTQFSEKDQSNQQLLLSASEKSDWFSTDCRWWFFKEKVAATASPRDAWWPPSASAPLPTWWSHTGCSKSWQVTVTLLHTLRIISQVCWKSSFVAPPQMLLGVMLHRMATPLATVALLNSARKAAVMQAQKAREAQASPHLATKGSAQQSNQVSSEGAEKSQVSNGADAFNVSSSLNNSHALHHGWGPAFFIALPHSGYQRYPH